MLSAPPPAQHPQRAQLHNEVHARPPEAISAPVASTHIVMLADAAGREASRAHVAALLRNHHQALPDGQTTHLRVDLGAYRLRWEMHTEFVSWTFTVPLQTEGFGEREPVGALSAVPRDWLAQLPGQCLCSLNLWVLPTKEFGSGSLVRHVLNEDTLVASTVADGHGEVYTDFAIHADGHSRMVLLTGGMTPRRLGRLVQRLQEIETYRMAALLGLPAAREATALLASAERELAELADAIRTANRHAEPALLDRLTRLAGMQTIGEFMHRRLTPARSTCEWAARRQEALSRRVSRISNLLRTRVEIEQQQSSQQLLGTMNDRQGTQLKLQSTVEGLSVAAITYYIVGLVSYLAKGAQPVGWPLSPETTAAIAIPVVGLTVWWSLRRLHHKMFKH